MRRNIWGSHICHYLLNIQSKWAWPWPWPLECVNVKCKYADRKTTCSSCVAIFVLWLSTFARYSQLRCAWPCPRELIKIKCKYTNQRQRFRVINKFAVKLIIYAIMRLKIRTDGWKTIDCKYILSIWCSACRPRGRIWPAHIYTEYGVLTWLVLGFVLDAVSS